MKTIKDIREATIKALPPAILGILGLLVGSIYSDLIPIISPTLSQQLPKPLLLKILTLAIILTALSWIWTYATYVRSKVKLFLQIGALWDKNNEPYCLVHQKPLARHLTEVNGITVTGLHCPLCDKTFQLITDDGKKLTLPEAKKLLKSINITQQVTPADR